MESSDNQVSPQAETAWYASKPLWLVFLLALVVAVVLWPRGQNEVEPAAAEQGKRSVWFGPDGVIRHTSPEENQPERSEATAVSSKKTLATSAEALANVKANAAENVDEPPLPVAKPVASKAAASKVDQPAAKQPASSAPEKQPESVAPATAKPVAEPRFWVQFGSFGQQANALKRAETLRPYSRDVRVDKLERNGAALYVVRSAVAGERAEAEALLSKVAEATGVKGFIKSAKP